MYCKNLEWRETIKFVLQHRRNNKRPRVSEAVPGDFYGGYLTSLSKEATCGRGKV